jgi:CheY-like chemotaxis protein
LEHEPVIQHWLVAVVRAAGLPGADALDIASDSDLTGAWDLVEMTAAVSPDDLAARVAAHYRLGVAELTDADPHAFKLLPGSVARKLQVLPLRYTDRFLTVATSDPVSLEAEKEIGHIAARAVHFEVASPQSIAQAVDATYPEEHEMRHEVPPLTAEAKGGPHVLVVDDDPDIRLLLRSVLENGGFRVGEATDGPEALDLLDGNDPYDLVTLDLKMTEMHGLEVLKRIRSRLSTATLPVVVATGSDDPEVEMELFEAGADDFIVKPVDPPRFLLRIQAVLRRRDPNPLAGLF